MLYLGMKDHDVIKVTVDKDRFAELVLFFQEKLKRDFIDWDIVELVLSECAFDIYRKDRISSRVGDFGTATLGFHADKVIQFELKRALVSSSGR